MTRRCGIQLPSGKSCPTFVRTDRNCCQACFDRKLQRIREQAPRSAPLMLPPPRRPGLIARILARL